MLLVTKATGHIKEGRIRQKWRCLRASIHMRMRAFMQGALWMSSVFVRSQKATGLPVAMVLFLVGCGHSGLRQAVQEDTVQQVRLSQDINTKSLFETAEQWYAGTHDSGWGRHYRRIKPALTRFARSKECENAESYYREVFLREPTSKLGVRAELRLADIAFCQRSYAEAITRYDSFKAAHPTQPSVLGGYADFQVAASRFHLLPVDYKITPPPYQKNNQELVSARDALLGFLQRFDEASVTSLAVAMAKLGGPGAEEKKNEQVQSLRRWRSQAEAMLDEVSVRLVQYELFVVRFHLRRGNLPAAMERAKNVRNVVGTPLRGTVLAAIEGEKKIP